MAELSQSAADSSPRPGGFRFSLLGLLVTTTLIAAALAVTSWRIWDEDEVWILRSWTCGALTLGILDRLRGKLGIVAAALGGGLAPAAVVLHLWQSPSTYPLPNTLWLSELGHNSVLLTLAAGATAAAAVAALCCLARWRPWWLVALALIVAAGLVAARPSIWKERSVFELTTNENPAIASPTPVLALTSDGTHLAVEHRAATNQSLLEIWSTSDRPHRIARAPVLGLWNINLAEFSPDGSQLAVGYSFGNQISIVDPQTAAWKSTLQMPDGFASVSRFRFTKDGSALVALGSLSRQPTVLAWDAKTHELLCQVAIPLPTPRVTSSTRIGLPESAAWAREQELAARRDWEPRTDSDNRWLALGRELLDVDLWSALGSEFLNVDRASRTPFVARSDEWVVVIHRLPMPSHWLKRCPFVRKFYRGDEVDQLKLVDSTSGQVFRTSRGIPSVKAVAISHDGGTLAAVTADFKVRIWDTRR
jgi:WD domain, G-beta repeat.